MLRENGISADIDIMGRKLGKAMKSASTVCARYAVIVGANELSRKAVTLRNMETGEQAEVPLDDLVKTIKG
jgi:histidyl-tRNA synthetase